MQFGTHIMPKYKALTSEYFHLMRYDAVLIGTYTSVDTDSYSMFCSAAMIYKSRVITFMTAITKTKLNALGFINVSGLKKFDVQR
jgi:hypothetical protein